MKRRWQIRERSWGLVKMAFGTQVYRELRALLPELLPGWWVLRAYLIVLVLAFLSRGDSNLRPIPNPFSSGVSSAKSWPLLSQSSSQCGWVGTPRDRQVRNKRLARRSLAVAATKLQFWYRPRAWAHLSYSYANIDPTSQQFRPGYYPELTNIYLFKGSAKALKDVLRFTTRTDAH